jgi:hypothetical protein
MDILQESLGGGSTHKTHNMVENVCIKWIFWRVCWFLFSYFENRKTQGKSA